MGSHPSQPLATPTLQCQRWPGNRQGGVECGWLHLPHRQRHPPRQTKQQQLAALVHQQRLVVAQRVHLTTEQNRHPAACHRLVTAASAALRQQLATVPTPPLAARAVLPPQLPLRPAQQCQRHPPARWQRATDARCPPVGPRPARRRRRGKRGGRREAAGRRRPPLPPTTRRTCCTHVRRTRHWWHSGPAPAQQRRRRPQTTPPAARHRGWQPAAGARHQQCR